MHTRRDLCRLTAVLAALVCGAIRTPCAGAQTAGEPPAAAPTGTTQTTPNQPRKPASSKSANVKSGDIATLDAAAETLTLRERSGKTSAYVLSDKTHFNKNRRSTQVSAFKVGDSVVIHFRRSRSDGALLASELDDATSWTWLTDMRRTTTPSVVKLITDDTLSVLVGPDRVPLDYTVSDKTHWEKAGKEVDATGFKPGDKVYVVPRSLPSGSIMARAVSDTISGAAQEKERLAVSVHGTIVSADMPAHKLVIKTVTGDVRNFAFSDETEVLQSGKALPLTTIKSGLHVSARIRHEAGGDEEIWRITLESPRKSSPSKKRLPTGKGVVTAH